MHLVVWMSRRAIMIPEPISMQDVSTLRATGAQILRRAILTQQHCMMTVRASNWIVLVNVGAMPLWIAMAIAMVLLSPNAMSVLEEILRLIR
tara:strand:- start:843 stop:1118 length:276 start_codon:yes stop_codon:yes gene_type:complete